MKKEIVFCDSCGNEVDGKHFYRASFVFTVNEWGGGSVGGDEDIFIQKADDLCPDCAHKLQRFIRDELKINPKHP